MCGDHDLRRQRVRENAFESFNAFMRENAFAHRSLIDTRVITGRQCTTTRCRRSACRLSCAEGAQRPGSIVDTLLAEPVDNNTLGSALVHQDDVERDCLLVWEIVAERDMS